MDSKQIVKTLNAINDAVTKNEKALNDLDQAQGDGDHGTNAQRGFEAVAKAVNDSMTPKEIFKTAAMTLMSQIGGSAGALLGSLTLQISNALPEGPTATLPELVKGFENGIQGMETVGQAKPGDKTMLDALVPAIEAMKANENDPKVALQKAAEAAAKGRDATKEMKATKGRAAYLGDRSIGHVDAGATTMALVFETIYEANK